MFGVQTFIFRWQKGIFSVGVEVFMTRVVLADGIYCNRDYKSWLFSWHADRALEFFF
jgi:hypothetical protein